MRGVFPLSLYEGLGQICALSRTAIDNFKKKFVELSDFEASTAGYEVFPKKSYYRTFQGKIRLSPIFRKKLFNYGSFQKKQLTLGNFQEETCDCRKFSKQGLNNENFPGKGWLLGVFRINI